jgi:hypothetical protein
MNTALLNRAFSTGLRCLTCSLLVFLAPTASAQTSRFSVNEANPVASVPSPEERRGAPLDFGYWLMDVADKGQTALTEGQFGKAAQYYEALTVAVPHRAVGFSKLCAARLGNGEKDLALEACREAMGKEGVTVADGTRLISLLLDQPRLTPEAVAEVESIILHLRKEKAHLGVVAEQECLLGEKLASPERLRSCLNELETSAASGGRVTAFKWRLAMLEKDGSRAKALLEEARRDPAFAPAAITRLEAETRALSSELTRRHLKIFGLVGLLLSALGLLAYFAIRTRRNRSSSAPLLA